MNVAKVSILTTHTCRWTLRLSVALREKGVPFQLTNVLKNGVKETSFIASTPFGKTPVLRHGDHFIPESLVICEYIDENFAGRPLLPQHPAPRAWARIWLRFCDDALIPALGKIVRATEAVQRQAAVQHLLEESERLEKFVVSNKTAGRYWLGNLLSLPDIGYYTFFEAVERSGDDVSAALLAACPSLSEWRQALVETKAFASAARELETLGESV